jgi:hypothetical protein
MKMTIWQIKKNQYVCTIFSVIIFLFITNTAYAGNFFQKGLQFFTGFGEDASQGDLTVGEIGEAFKSALRIGADSVVSQLGQEDGFNTDAAVHIPLPAEFEIVKTTMDKIGMSFLVDDLELKLNRAAEEATPKAKELFLQAITDMTFEDVMNIYNGPEDSATKYFQDKMSPSLAKEMQPIIENSLSQVGAVKTYDDVINKYESIPFVPDIKTNLTNYVTKKGMDGIFHYMAKEETAIRENPAKQTTELLKRVFSAN